MRLVERRLPTEFDVTGDADAWPLTAHALLSRMTGTVDSVLRLQPTGRGADAMTLVRSLYEHTVHFAWLAADPTPERMGNWRKHDLTQRLKADNDANSVGVQLYTPEQRTHFEAQRDALPGPKELVLANVAAEADDYWEPRIDFLQTRHQLRSFRGMYATAYRLQSGVAHPGERSIHPVVEDLTAVRKRVKLEDHIEGRGPYGIVSITYGLGLLIAAQALGWPSAHQVERVFSRYE